MKRIGEEENRTIGILNNTICKEIGLIYGEKGGQVYKWKFYAIQLYYFLMLYWFGLLILILIIASIPSILSTKSLIIGGTVNTIISTIVYLKLRDLGYGRYSKLIVVTKERIIELERDSPLDDFSVKNNTTLNNLNELNYEENSIQLKLTNNDIRLKDTMEGYLKLRETLFFK